MTCSRAIAWGCGLAILCFAARPADAGLLSIDVTPRGTPPASGPPALVWELLPEQSGTAHLVLQELFGADLGGTFAVDVTGSADSSAVMTITKQIENASGLAWIGYLIDLDSDGAATFGGTPSSDKLTLTSQSAHNLTFGLPSAVPDGESVSFAFDIIIPATGPFGFTVTQAPVLIPEPASAALLGIALLAVGLSGPRRRA